MKVDSQVCWVSSEDVFVQKLWGYERIQIRTELYTLKEMTVLPGFRSSLHYHQLKHESFVVTSGCLRLDHWEVDPERCAEQIPRGMALLREGCAPWKTRVLFPGEKFSLPSYVVHRFQAAGVVPCVFTEVSTQDLATDNYRLLPSGPVDG